LILDDYMRRGNRARFRIFHAESGSESCYEALFRAILPHAAGVGRLYVYVQEERTRQHTAVKALGFAAERLSFLLLREDKPIGDPLLPQGCTIAEYEPGRDAPAWCAVRNAAFATLKGSETPITEDMADRSNGAAIPGGAMLLKIGGEAVGVVRAEEDDVDGPAANIGPLAILPAWQGKGLGRALLRAALRNAKEHGYGRAVLCVNGENQRAAALYLQEGFRQVEAVTCYRYDIGQS
jgi:mycothiol synthase